MGSRGVVAAVETEKEAETLVLVRATVSMSGLSIGREAFVDPSDPYIAAAIGRGFLVPVERNVRSFR